MVPQQTWPMPAGRGRRITRAQARAMRKGYPGVTIPGAYLPQRSYTSRAVRRLARVSWRLTRRTWVRRRPLAPLLAALLTVIVGVIAHAVPKGGPSILTLAALFAIAAGGRELLARRRPSWFPIRFRKLRRGELAYLAGITVGTTGWLYWAAVAGVLPPRPFFLLALWMCAQIPAALKYRAHDEVATAGPHPMVAMWNEYGASDNGLAPASVMHAPDPIVRDGETLGVAAVVEFPRGSTLNPLSLAQHTVRIASIYDTDLSSIAVDQAPNIKSVRFAQVSVFTRNPLRDEGVYWPGADEVFDPATGAMKFSWYLTGGTTTIRYWDGSGPKHLLVAGATGTGKSGAFNEFLAVERKFGPLMSSVIIDPQQGQSLPRWRGQTAYYATSAAEGEDVLAALHDDMLARNAMLSEVEYEDEYGHHVRGMESFNPTHPVIRALGLSLTCVTIDEAAMLLKRKWCVSLLEDLLTGARKCGQRYTLAFQTPLLDQVKTNVIREQFSQQVLFRTGSPISANAVNNGVLPASPHRLPRDLPGACYVISDEARPVISRTRLPQSTYALAHEGETTLLPDLVARIERRRKQSRENVVPTQRTGVVDAEVIDDVDEVDTRSYGEKILAYFDERPGYATTGVLATYCGVDSDGPMNSISSACRRLERRGKLIDHGRAMWGSLDTEGEAPGAEVAA